MNKSPTFNIRSVDTETKKMLKHIAIDLGVPMAQALKVVLKEYLENHKDK